MKNQLKSIVLCISGVLLLTIRTAVAQNDLPMMDLHVHLTYSSPYDNSPAFAYRTASERSRNMKVIFGIAEEFETNNVNTNDTLVGKMSALAKKFGMYLGLQVEKRDWQQMFSAKAINKVDYILADAMIFPDKKGKMLYIWVPKTDLGDINEFMELYFANNLKVLSEPITIWGNPTFLPDYLMPQYDQLWTDDRIKSLIDACVKNNIAIEINSTYKIPDARVIKMAKAAGAHFTFGSNKHNTGIGEISWSVNMARECGLTKNDFFIPKRKL